MRYLIDGHNLIPHIDGLNLRQEDDEQRLIGLLQDFCRTQRASVEVYFDNAAPGQAPQRSFGSVTAHFVRRGQTADAAILQRLISIKRSARQWCVVSSDQRVRAGAREAQAKLMQSEEFARLMQSTPRGGAAEKPLEAPLGEEDVEAWLQFFKDPNSKKSG